MKAKLLALLAIFLLVSLLFAPFYREIQREIYIDPSGGARIKIHELVHGKELVDLYMTHHKASQSYKEIRKQFFKELAKVFYQIYGSTPYIESFKVIDTSVKKDFERTIEAEVSGLLGVVDARGGIFRFSRKHFKDENTMLSYFESCLDERFFESAFLDQFKGVALETVEKTEIFLPRGSEIVDVVSPFSKEFKNRLEFKTPEGNYRSVEVKIYKDHITVVEDKITVAEAPDILLSDKNVEYFDALRDMGSFDVIFHNEKMDPRKLSKPVTYDPKMDFSRGWNYHISLTISNAFKYSKLTVKPGMTFGVNLGVHLYWKHKWKRVSWYRYKHVLEKFEGKISIDPYTQLFVNLHSEGSYNKSWTKNLTRKRKDFVFWVSGVPVWIALIAAVNAKAEVGVSGSLDVNVSAKFTVNTSVTFKYQHGWSKSFSKSYNYSGIQFSANAKASAWVEGDLPISFRGYIYNIGGPYVRFTPWLKGETNASVGSDNQVGYKVTGGLKVNGGVRMAGWLRKLCGNIGSKSYELWSKTWTLKQGTLTF